LLRCREKCFLNHIADCLMKPILVTGSHRSGSTWVGTMLARSTEVTYVHEPFNIRPRPRICHARFCHWFTYVCEENEANFITPIRACLSLKYNLVKGLKATRNLRDLAHVVDDYWRLSVGRAFRRRPLMKDPIAVFSAEWLARVFDMDVIVLIRHPAAFAGSLKVAKSSHPFEHFLAQPLLMDHYLDSFREEVQACVDYRKDIIDQSILLWRMIHHMILIYMERHRDWIFVRHEDLSSDPVHAFSVLFDRLGLIYSSKVQKAIEHYSSGGGASLWNRRRSLKRDSKSNIWRWKERLTKEEVERVYRGTLDIAANFYTDEDW
jgi:hypothetical protein